MHNFQIVVKAILFFCFALSSGKQNVSKYSTYWSVNNSDYFSTLVCLDNESEFIIVEELGKEHKFDTYFEKGFYEEVNDSIFFNVIVAGLDDGSIINEEQKRKALFKNDTMEMLNNLDKVYIRLELTKSKTALDECLRINKIFSVTSK